MPSPLLAIKLCIPYRGVIKEALRFFHQRTVHLLLLHSYFRRLTSWQPLHILESICIPRMEGSGQDCLSSHLSFIATSLGSAADLSQLGNRDHTLLGPWEQRQNPTEIIYPMIKILTALRYPKSPNVKSRLLFHLLASQ